MKTVLATFVSDERGSTAVEYGAIAMLIGLALVAVLDGIGLGLSETFTQLKSIFSSSAGAATH